MQNACIFAECMSIIGQLSPLPTPKMQAFLVLNGPNLNLLGHREPEIYGDFSLTELEKGLQQRADELNCSVRSRQSNAESQLIEWIQRAGDEGFAGIVLNPAAYSHTSLALADAVAACAVPVLEVHISNIHAREEIRHISLISPVAAGIITGLGESGYYLALRALKEGFADRGED